MGVWSVCLCVFVSASLCTFVTVSMCLGEVLKPRRGVSAKSGRWGGVTQKKTTSAAQAIRNTENKQQQKQINRRHYENKEQEQLNKYKRG